MKQYLHYLQMTFQSYKPFIFCKILVLLHWREKKTFWRIWWNFKNRSYVAENPNCDFSLLVLCLAFLFILGPSMRLGIPNPKYREVTYTLVLCQKGGPRVGYLLFLIKFVGIGFYAPYAVNTHCRQYVFFLTWVANFFTFHFLKLNWYLATYNQESDWIVSIIPGTTTNINKGYVYNFWIAPW